MSAFSKSMFSNSAVSSTNRFIYNPVSIYSGGGNNDLNAISKTDLTSIKTIERLYTLNMENKKYEYIPNDYTQYIQLYMVIQLLLQKTKNATLLLLFNIVKEALVGSINSYTIYGDNVSLRLINTDLNKQISNFGKNKIFVEMTNTSGQMTLKKTFKLAAIFNYYILIYGMPDYGVGFDPVRISYLMQVLQKMGINPYK